MTDIFKCQTWTLTSQRSCQRGKEISIEKLDRKQKLQLKLTEVYSKRLFWVPFHSLLRCMTLWLSTQIRPFSLNLSMTIRQNNSFPNRRQPSIQNYTSYNRRNCNNPKNNGVLDLLLISIIPILKNNGSPEEVHPFKVPVRCYNPKTGQTFLNVKPGH